MKKLVVLGALCSLAVSATAGIMIYPKYLFLDDKTKSAEVTLVNSSALESSNYRVTLTYKKQNPDGSPKACMQDTGLSKNTVYKWCNQVPKKEPEKSDFSIKLERLEQFFLFGFTEPKDDPSRLKRLNAYQIGLKQYLSKDETSEEKTP